MKSIRYRSPEKSTRHVLPRFKHVARLGKLLDVRGYRFTSTRKAGYDRPLTTDHEAVLVRGENGTARFSGVCWSYRGEGPRGLFDLLTAHCGVPKDKAEAIAFYTPRNQHDQTDWVYHFDSGRIVLPPVQLRLIA